MCYCTPEHRVPFCDSCYYEMFREIQDLKKANQNMHNMIMDIRKYVGAWDTPTAPTDKDIVECIKRNIDEALFRCISNTKEYEATVQYYPGTKIPSLFSVNIMPEEMVGKNFMVILKAKG